MSQESDRSWSLGDPELRADNTSVVVGLNAENEHDKNRAAKSPVAVVMEKGSQIIFYGNLVEVEKSDFNNAHAGACFINTGNADEVAAWKALCDDWLAWDLKRHPPARSFWPPVGIKRFQFVGEEYNVAYEPSDCPGASEDSRGLIKLIPLTSNNRLLPSYTIPQPSALAFVIKSTPDLFRIRDKMFAAEEQQQQAGFAAKEQQMQEAIKAEKEASAQRLKDFQRQEELKANLSEKNKQIDEIKAQEEAQKAEIKINVKKQKTAQIMDYLASKDGQELSKKIDSLKLEIGKQDMEESKEFRALQKQWLDYVQTHINPSHAEQLQADDYSRQFVRFASNYKESPSLQQKRQQLLTYFAQFQEACKCSYDDAMEVKASASQDVQKP